MSIEKAIFWAFAKRALMSPYISSVTLRSVKPLVVAVVIEGELLADEDALDRELTIRRAFIETVQVLSPEKLYVGDLWVEFAAWPLPTTPPPLDSGGRRDA